MGFHTLSPPSPAEGGSLLLHCRNGLFLLSVVFVLGVFLPNISSRPLFWFVKNVLNSALPCICSSFTLSIQCKLMETMVCVHLGGIKMLAEAWWAPLHPPVQYDNLLPRTTNQLSKVQPVLPGLPQGMTAALGGGPEQSRHLASPLNQTSTLYRFCALCQPVRQEAPSISAKHSVL